MWVVWGHSVVTSKGAGLALVFFTSVEPAEFEIFNQLLFSIILVSSSIASSQREASNHHRHGGRIAASLYPTPGHVHPTPSNAVCSSIGKAVFHLTQKIDQHLVHHGPSPQSAEFIDLTRSIFERQNLHAEVAALGLDEKHWLMLWRSLVKSVQDTLRRRSRKRCRAVQGKMTSATVQINPTAIKVVQHISTTTVPAAKIFTSASSLRYRVPFTSIVTHSHYKQLCMHY